MSVKIIDFKQRESLEGKQFYALILQGGLEIVQSANGNSYATIKTASMPSTFDENTCKSLVGTEMPGRIERVETAPYEFTIHDTGEVILLSHRYEYVEEPANQEFSKVYQSSENGVKELA